MKKTKYSFSIKPAYENVYTLRVYDDYEQNNSTWVMSLLDTLDKIYQEIEYYTFKK